MGTITLNTFPTKSRSHRDTSQCVLTRESSAHYCRSSGALLSIFNDRLKQKDRFYLVGLIRAFDYSSYAVGGRFFVHAR